MNNALALIGRNKATLATVEAMRDELRLEAERLQHESETAEKASLAEFYAEAADRYLKTGKRLGALAETFAAATREIEAAMYLIPVFAFAEAKE